MELYGSLHNISGSVTASAFSGSFIGDGSGLVGIQASGVTGLNLSQIANADATASISSSGFTVNKNTQIQGNLAVTGSIIANEYIVSSSVVYMTTSYASGSSAFGNDNNDVHQFTGSVQITGSISLNGEPIGTGKLNETTFQSYTSSNNSRVSALETSSGSLNSFTSSIDTTIKSKLNTENVISGSVQVNITGTTGYSTFSSSVSSSIGDLSSSLATTTSGLTSNNTSLSSSVATTTSNLSTAITNLSSSVAITDLAQTNRLNSIEGVSGSYATTGSNTFKGTQNISGSIIPTIDNAFDLGSPTYQWRDVYISSGSLYIDGTKVISSTTQELTITTDTGQSIKILEGTTDSIILQTADGDIELKSSGDGDILLDPTNGKIMLKGAVEILNGQKIQSSVGGTPVVFANDIVVSGSIDLTGTIEGINLTDFSSSVNTRVGNLESSNGSLNSYTSSNTSNINAIHTATSSLNSFTSSINTTIKSKLNADGVISGSVQVNITGTTGYSTFSSSISASVGELSSSIATLNLDQNGRLNSIEGKTGSYATTGSNIFKSSQTISGSVIITENLTVFGSSSITYVTSSQLRIEDNIITVNTASPGSRFGGLEVHDSGSVGIATGSLLWDSVNNRWIYQQSSEATYGGGVLLSGPRSSGSLGSELTLTSGRIAKSAGGDHLNDSNISDDGTTVTINSATVINGTLISTGTTLVSGSAQISHDSTTGYVANKHIDHTAVSISAGNGLSGGGDISATRTLTLDTASATFTSGVKSKMNTDGVISGSAQLPSGIISGSAQLPSGLVSGSSQIAYGSITGVPSGLVSGSAQVDLTATTNYSSGIKTRLNAEGVISGSAQVAYGSITGVPSGLVSGSAQITLSSTSGFGSYLNQAVLTTSSPTFAGITSSGPVTITGNGSYLGDWGYGTLTLNDTGGYPGIFFRNSGNIWMLRRNGADNGFDFAYSTNATGQGTGTFTQQGKWVAGGDLYVRGQIYVGGNGSSTGTQLVYNSGTWSISINGNAATATTATTAGALSSMNISQFTNNSGYITSDSTKLPLAGGTMTGTITITSTDIRSNASSGWTGDPGTQGKIQYHSNRWYIVADQDSNRIVQFRRNGTDVSYIDNSGVYQGSISGNAATAGGFTPSQTSGTANRIVVADANGYIVNNYFNASGGGSERNASGMGYFAGHNTSDYYYRSYTAAAAAALLSGQSMNISGTATNITQYTINQSVGTGNAPTFAGGTINGSLYVNANNDVTSLAGSVTLYSTGNATTSMIMFKNTTGLGYGNHGGIAGTYNTYFVMDTTDRGWVFRNATTSTNIASISNTGVIAANSHLYTGGYILRTSAGQGWLSGNYGTAETGSSSHVIYSIGGSYVPSSSSLGNMYGIGYANAGGGGYAFQMTSASGWGLYIASNGTPYAFIGSEGNSSVFRSTILPHSNNAHNLGSATYRWANLYTNDLHLSNEGKEGGNEIDGTTGDWTIQEGEENLYIINHKNGKKFKIDLTEII